MKTQLRKKPAARPFFQYPRKWLLAALLFSQTLLAIDVYQFDTPQQEALYRHLTEELRCLVCQNQNIADSDADLAKDLRQEVAQFVKQGKTQEEIIDYLVQRYGDFVRYSPPVRIDTIVLWTLPFAVLLFGGWGLIRTIKANNQTNAAAIAKTHSQPTSADSPTEPDS